MRLRDLIKLVEQLSVGASLSPGKTVTRPNPNVLRGGDGGPDLIQPLTPDRPNLVVAHFIVTNAALDEVQVMLLLDQLVDESDPGGLSVIPDEGHALSEGVHDIALTGIVPAGIDYGLIEGAVSGTPAIVLNQLRETPL